METIKIEINYFGFKLLFSKGEHKNPKAININLPFSLWFTKLVNRFMEELSRKGVFDSETLAYGVMGLFKENEFLMELVPRIPRQAKDFRVPISDKIFRYRPHEQRLDPSPKRELKESNRPNNSGDPTNYVRKGHYSVPFTREIEKFSNHFWYIKSHYFTIGFNEKNCRTLENIKITIIHELTHAITFPGYGRSHWEFRQIPKEKWADYQIYLVDKIFFN